MQVLSGLRVGLIAIAALLSAASVANADSGTISIRIFKAGFIVGGSAGSGVLTFQGRSYPLSIGGLSYGFTFGASETHFHGTVSNIRRPSDVAGVYAQGGAGAAVIKGAQAVVLTNQSGAVLTLTGEQNGLIVSLDLSGLALSLKQAAPIFPRRRLPCRFSSRRDEVVRTTCKLPSQTDHRRFRTGHRRVRTRPLCACRLRDIDTINSA
jgi:hypothetical protein